MPSTTYRAHDFMKAATQLGIEVVIGSDHKQALSRLLPDFSLALNFQKPESSIEKIKKFAHKNSLTAILGVDEETVIENGAEIGDRVWGFCHKLICATG